MHRTNLSVLCLIFLLLSFSVFCDEPKVLTSDKDWIMYSMKQDGDSLCYIGSFPIKKSGTYRSRNDPHVAVIYVPDGVDELNVHAGYQYKRGSEVVVELAGKKYHLLTKGDSAWLKDQDADREVIEKMKRSKELIVKAVSHKGTSSTDVYSMMGFTKMYDQMRKICGNKN